MKKTAISRGWAVIRLCVLYSIVICLSGCAQITTGETPEEVHIRHTNIMKSNTGLMQHDLDALFLLDKPSKLSDKLIR